MEALKNPDGSFTPSLLFATGLLLLSLFFISQMKDPLELTQIK
jgi:multisubunit Na+/H+ antiporter MnhB subunit